MTKTLELLAAFVQPEALLPDSRDIPGVARSQRWYTAADVG